MGHALNQRIEARQQQQCTLWEEGRGEQNEQVAVAGMDWKHWQIKDQKEMQKEMEMHFN